MDYQEETPRRISKTIQLQIFTKSLNKDDLNEEHQSSFQESVKLFKCAMCKFSSKIRGNLKKHVKSVHNKEKPFKCEICQNSYSGKSYLNIHKRTVHANEKPFQCEICQIFLKNVHENDKHFV